MYPLALVSLHTAVILCFNYVHFGFRVTFFHYFTKRMYKLNFASATEGRVPSGARRN